MIIAVVLAALAVVAAVVVLASGGGGELAETHPDHPPLALSGNRPIAGTDAALLRLPVGVWGYHVRVSDEALRRLAHALTERDTRIAILEQQVAELRHKLESLQPAPASAEQSPDTWPATPERQAAWTPPAQSLELELGSRADPNARWRAEPGPRATPERPTEDSRAAEEGAD